MTMATGIASSRKSFLFVTFLAEGYRQGSPRSFESEVRGVRSPVVQVHL